jgi:hypothetical protein
MNASWFARILVLYALALFGDCSNFIVDVTRISTFQIDLRIGAHFPTPGHYEHCFVHVCEISAVDGRCHAFARLHRAVVEGAGSTFETELTLHDLSHGLVRRLLDTQRNGERLEFGLALNGRKCPGVFVKSTVQFSAFDSADADDEARIEQVTAVCAACPGPTSFETTSAALVGLSAFRCSCPEKVSF